MKQAKQVHPTRKQAMKAKTLMLASLRGKPVQVRMGEGDQVEAIRTITVEDCPELYCIARAAQ